MKQAKPAGVESHTYLRKMIEGWFLGTNILEIRHGNVSSWVSWAFVGKDLNELTSEEVEDNNLLVQFIEKELQWTFPPGTNDHVHSIRLTLDPLFATQRPFFYYAVIAFVNLFAHIVLYLAGFRLRTDGFYPSDTTPPSTGPDARRLRSVSQSIYHRPSSGRLGPSMRKMPIVFVHGIGIGFAHYLGLLLSLPWDTDIYLVEWPH
eukprot:gene6434-8212_t